VVTLVVYKERAKTGICCVFSGDHSAAMLSVVSQQEFSQQQATWCADRARRADGERSTPGGHLRKPVHAAKFAVLRSWITTSCAML